MTTVILPLGMWCTLPSNPAGGGNGGQFLDRAGLPAGINDVADAELVFQKEEESREVIFDQTLRSESDGNTDDPGGSRIRAAQLPEDENGPQQSDCDCQHIAYDARKRGFAVRPRWFPGGRRSSRNCGTTRWIVRSATKWRMAIREYARL